MTMTMPERWTPEDFFRVFELHVRYGQFIERYVNNRVFDQEAADRAVAAVFHAAVEAGSEIPDPPLPWLIARARHECAEARRTS